ncbi:secretory phospholipase A2 [Metarhizium guizhouense ARSEF 977]|uniref:Secretory phospholipase A2 n=1 Tax=Metarhizium guizhouense (strain ARSEF 977) TaxID=1276136 RepID=A0A0B4H5L5_METGA|nr:secretory phospholipase A2 [Metarhizium guizhouense ARSEF 977]
MKALSTIFAVVFVATTAVLPTSTPTKALHHLENRATCTNAVTYNLIFAVSIGSFEKSCNAKDPPGCNWSSDNCSWSPDKPDGFNFIPSCHRHDFGYRNTKAQKRFTSEMKTRIDDNCKKDLYKYCSQFSGIWPFKGVECRRIADIYVAFVQKLGKRDGDEFGFTLRDNSGLDIDE